MIEELLSEHDSSVQKDQQEAQEKKNKSRLTSKSKQQRSGAEEKLTESKKMTVDIWDLSGNYAYYPALLPTLVKRAVYLVVFDLTSDLDALATSDSNSRMQKSHIKHKLLAGARRHSSLTELPTEVSVKTLNEDYRFFI
jgi:hypothetical protein